jgi:hypothetical protein
MDGEMTRAKAIKSMSTSKLNPSRVRGSARLPGRARRVGTSALILFALWSGGFGCLWCCASDLPKGCCDQRNAAMVHHAGQACSAHRSCCEPTESHQRAAIKSDAQSAATPCCLIGADTNGPAAFPRSQYHQTLTAAITETFTPVAQAFAAPLISGALPANKGSTYLRCCVLLI